MSKINTPKPYKLSVSITVADTSNWQEGRLAQVNREEVCVRTFDTVTEAIRDLAQQCSFAITKQLGLSLDAMMAQQKLEQRILLDGGDASTTTPQ